MEEILTTIIFIICLFSYSEFYVNICQVAYSIYNFFFWKKNDFPPRLCQTYLSTNTLLFANISKDC